MRISCSIVAHEDVRLTMRLLKSCVNQKGISLPQVDFQLILENWQLQKLTLTEGFFEALENLDLTLTIVDSIQISTKRNLALTSCMGDHLLCLDGDTELSGPHFFANVIDRLEEIKAPTLLAGSYMNGEACSFWGRSYNFIADIWLKRSADFPELNHFLGGVFLIVNDDKNNLKKLRFEENVFGGEEIKFARDLREQNYSIVFCEKLSVFHNSRHSLKSFFNRAIIHGRAARLPSTSAWLNSQIFFYTRAAFFEKLVALVYLAVARIHGFRIQKKRNIL